MGVKMFSPIFYECNMRLQRLEVVQSIEDTTGLNVFNEN